MSSIASSFKQNPTNTFSVLGSSGAWLHSLDNLVGSFAADSYTNVGEVYTIDTIANFITFVNNVSGGGSGGTYEQSTVNETLIDMGREFIVGVANVNPTLLKFRLVRRTNGRIVADGYKATNSIGYVIVENRVSQDDIDSPSIDGNLNVKVGRV